MNWRGPERSRTVERALLLVLAKVPLWSLWYKNKYRELYLECGSLLPLFFSWSCHSALAFSRTPYPGALFCTSENHNSFLFMGLPTFGQKHPRGGVPPTTSAKALARKTRNGVRAGGNQSQVTTHDSTRPFSSISSSLSHRSGKLAEPSRRISSSAPRTSLKWKSTPMRSSNSISACAPSASAGLGSVPTRSRR